MWTHAASVCTSDVTGDCKCSLSERIYKLQGSNTTCSVTGDYQTYMYIHFQLCFLVTTLSTFAGVWCTSWRLSCAVVTREGRRRAAEDRPRTDTALHQRPADVTTRTVASMQVSNSLEQSHGPLAFVKTSSYKSIHQIIFHKNLCKYCTLKLAHTRKIYNNCMYSSINIYQHNGLTLRATGNCWY